MKKLATLITLLLVPFLSFVINAIYSESVYLTKSIIWSSFFLTITFLSIVEINWESVKKKDLFIGTLIGMMSCLGVRTISFLTFLSGLATTTTYLCSLGLNIRSNFKLTWKQDDRNSDALIISVIITCVFILYFLLFGSQLLKIKPRIDYFIWALGPAISEEVIFRMYLPLRVAEHFKLERNLGSLVWVYLLITIPFAQMHFYSNGPFGVLLMSAPIFVVVNRYGLKYGILAHFLLDLLNFALGI